MIALLDVDAEGARAVAAEVSGAGAHAVPITCDVGDPASCRGAWDAVGASADRIDIVVSNAGTQSPPTPFVDIDLDSWARQLDVNLTAHFIIGQLAARSMIGRGGGVILFTGTVAALAGGGEFAPYCASKAGLLALMRVMAVELAAHRIRVNAVSPGPVDTPFSAAFVSEEQREQLRRSFPVIPMNRMARPEEVADAFAFLASDDAAYITGHNLVVDGGLIVQLGRGRAWPEGESGPKIAPATG